MHTIGRPARDETIDYYFPYIDLVPDGDVRQILADQQAETVAFLNAVPESRGDHRYEPGKWSVTEVLSHINDCERLYTMRAFWFAREMAPPLPSFESDRAVQTAQPANVPWKEHVGEFASIRAATVALFRHLPDEAWVRRGIASDYPFTVRALAYITVGHVIHHTQILKTRYL